MQPHCGRIWSRCACGDARREGSKAPAIEPFSGPFFAPRAPLKFHKKQLLTRCHFGLYDPSFSCQTKPALSAAFRRRFERSPWPNLLARPRPLPPITIRIRSRSSRASTRCASGRACISAIPMTARAFTTWSTRWSTTPSTRRWRASLTRWWLLSIRTAPAPCATTAAASRPTSTREKGYRPPRSS